MTDFNNVPSDYQGVIFTAIVHYHIRCGGDSSGTHKSYKSIHCADTLAAGQKLFSEKEDWAKMEIVSVGEEEVEVLWRGKYKYTVGVNDLAIGGAPLEVDSPWIAEGGYRVAFFYGVGTPASILLNKVESLREKHRLHGIPKDRAGWREEDQTTLAVEEIKDEHNSHSVDVLKQLLLSVGNWSAFKVEDNSLLNSISCFSKDSYLSPQDQVGWRVIKWLFEDNEPASVIKDYADFNDRLIGAALRGDNEDAASVFNAYATSIQKVSLADYSHLLLAYKSFRIDTDSRYPLIEKTLLTTLPEPPASDIEEPKWAKVSSEPDAIVARLYEIMTKMQANHDAGKVWRNIPLLKEAFSYRHDLPDVLPGHFETPADKADLYVDIAKLTNASLTPHLLLEVREYIDSLYAQCPDLAAANKKHTINSEALQKRRDDLDPSISIEDYCKKYKVEYLYDPVELTPRYEEIVYALEEEVAQRLAPYSIDDNAIEGFKDLERARVLGQYDIQWRDTMHMNPDLNLCYFMCQVNGENYYINNVSHYGVMKAFADLERCTDEECIYHLIVIYANMKLWSQEDSYLAAASIGELLAEMRNIFDTLQTGATSPAEAREAAMKMLEPLSDIASAARMERKSAENPSQEEALFNQRHSHISEVEDMMNEGLSRADLELQEKLEEIEREGLELIEKYERHDLYLQHHLLRLVIDNTLELTSPSEFREAVATGISDYGCLTPDRTFDWQIISLALCGNDEKDIIPDMEQFEDLMLQALDEGDEQTREAVEKIIQMIEEEPEEDPCDTDHEEEEPTMSFGGLTESDEERNVVPTQAYSYQIGSRYVEVRNSDLASAYYDLRCLEARFSKDSFLSTLATALESILKVNEKHSLQTNDTAKTVLQTLTRIFKDVFIDATNVDEARQSIYSISEALQDLATLVDDLDCKGGE